MSSGGKYRQANQPPRVLDMFPPTSPDAEDLNPIDAGYPYSFEDNDWVVFDFMLLQPQSCCAARSDSSTPRYTQVYGGTSEPSNLDELRVTDWQESIVSPKSLSYEDELGSRDFDNASFSLFESDFLEEGTLDPNAADILQNHPLSCLLERSQVAQEDASLCTTDNISVFPYEEDQSLEADVRDALPPDSEQNFLSVPALHKKDVSPGSTHLLSTNTTSLLEVVSPGIEDKRQRNKQASTRFRKEKKKRNKALQDKVRNMSKACQDLDMRLKELSCENIRLKELLFLSSQHGSPLFSYGGAKSQG